MTKEEIVSKLKNHLTEEEADAKAYYEMAKEARKVGDSKLTSMLVDIAQEELCHRHKIRKYLGMNGIRLDDEEENEKMDFIAFQLKKM